jgi:hypothetical protein
MQDAEELIRITAPYFCAGVILQGGRVARFAPILHYMRGWSADRVEAYAGRKGWTCERVWGF